MTNQPVVRNYVLWFLFLSVVLAVRPSMQGSTHSWWIETYWNNVASRLALDESESETCAVVTETLEPPPSSHSLGVLFDGLRTLEELRKDPSERKRLEATASIPITRAAPQRTRQSGNVALGLKRVQEQLTKDLETHQELCLASVHVGVPIRMIVLSTAGTLVNPSIVSASETTRKRLEATAFEPSTLKPKERAVEVTVKYETLEDDAVYQTIFRDIDAQCVLHLLDTLDAVPF